jgi:peptidoglycan/xylan/chitin deacetylase (PgdA/CDA1 family)
MSGSIRRIKIIILVILPIITIGLVFGVMNLEGDYYWQKNFALMQWRFLTTRTEYLIQNIGLLGGNSQNSMKSIQAGKFASSVPVLLYHGVIEESNWVPDEVNVRFDDFREQMMLLKSLGYETVSLDDFLAFVNGEKNLPEKSFLLTFDDGRKDSYYTVDPILKALGYQAVMFTITGRSLDQDKRANTFHLDEVELEKMAGSGRWDIESHTKNGHDLEAIDAVGTGGHFLSNKLWLKYEGRLETNEEYQKRIENDLLASKTDIEKKLGRPVKAFAYPFGDFGLGSVNFSESQNVILPLVQKIFPYSFYQARESDYAGNYPNRQFLLKRLTVNSEISPEKLATALMNSQEKIGQSFEDRFQKDNGWMEGWGKRQFKDGLMLTGPTDSEDSSLTFLNGTYLWRNYTFESEVQLIKGRAFALLARYQDGNDYASCDFGENELSINEHRDGVDYTLAQIPFSSQIFFSQAKTGISVNDQDIACLVGGKSVLNATLNSKLSQGGIGFKTWDNQLFNSELLVKKVNVNNLTISERKSFRGVITLAKP